MRRVRGIACSLIFQAQELCGRQFPSTHAVWTWAFVHAAWLLSRFVAVQGVTPFELCKGKAYSGRLVCFLEPAQGASSQREAKVGQDLVFDKDNATRCICGHQWSQSLLDSQCAKNVQCVERLHHALQQI